MWLKRIFQHPVLNRLSSFYRLNIRPLISRRPRRKRVAQPQRAATTPPPAAKRPVYETYEQLIEAAKTPLEETIERFEYRLKTGADLHETEHWFVDRLMHIMQNRSGKKRRPWISGRPHAPARRIVLVNRSTGPKEVESIRQCCLQLKNAYLYQRDSLSALRMLRIASVFGPLPAEELRWAIATAKAEGLHSGYWVAMAGLQVTEGKPDKNSLDLLQLAGEKGDEYARLILACKDQI